MRTTWIVGMCLLFIIGSMISFTLEGMYVGEETQYVDAYGNPCSKGTEGAKPVGVISTFDKLMKPKFTQSVNLLTGIIEFILWVWSWVQAFWIMLSWDYSFLVGSWQILKYFGWCLSIGIVVGLVLAVRGTGST